MCSVLYCCYSVGVLIRLLCVIGAPSPVAATGLAHALSGEEGTLLKLSETDDADTKLTYEYGHVVNFPNILYHAVHDHVRGKGNSIAAKKH